MKNLPLPLKVAILDKETVYAGVLKAIIETKTDIEVVKTFKEANITDNALRHEKYNTLFIDIFSIGAKQGTDFISHVRTQYPVVPICLYSFPSMLSEMKGISDYWKNRLGHYYRLKKDQTVESLNSSAEDMIYAMAYELEFNLAKHKTSEIRERIEEESRQPIPRTQRKEDTADLQELLGVYRRTLIHYLKQQAMQGTAFVPPGVDHGILEARKNIRYIKGSLRNWGVIVEDYPYDEDNLG